MKWLMVPRDGTERNVPTFTFYKRGWCSAGCGRRELQRVLDHRGGACEWCYREAKAHAEHDDEQRSLRHLSDEERARI